MVSLLNAASVNPPASRETIRCRRGEISRSGRPNTSRCKLMQASYSSIDNTSRIATSAETISGLGTESGMIMDRAEQQIDNEGNFFVWNSEIISCWSDHARLDEKFASVLMA